MPPQIVAFTFPYSILSLIHLLKIELYVGTNASCSVVKGSFIEARWRSENRERERELRREGGKSLLAYVKGVDPHPNTYR